MVRFDEQLWAFIKWNPIAKTEKEEVDGETILSTVGIAMGISSIDAQCKCPIMNVIGHQRLEMRI